MVAVGCKWVGGEKEKMVAIGSRSIFVVVLTRAKHCARAW